MPTTESERPINIIRGAVDSLTLYEVMEDELNNLENGSTSSTYLNLAIALLTLCLSFFASIFTVDFKNNITFIVFLVIALVSLFAGVGYIITWYKTRKSYTSIITKIRARAEKKQVLIVKTDKPDEIIIEENVTIPAATEVDK
jgi:hypothetical protein